LLYPMPRLCETDVCAPYRCRRLGTMLGEIRERAYPGECDAVSPLWRANE